MDLCSHATLASLLLAFALFGLPGCPPKPAVEAREEDCLTDRDRSFDLGSFRVFFSLSRPLRPLTELAVRVHVADASGPVAGLRPTLSFFMDMDMGKREHTLQGGGGDYEARLVLPVCMQGGKRWYARLRLGDGGPEKVFWFDF